MGNQIPESHNQSSTTSEIQPIVESVVTDLVNAVQIKESIMSDNDLNTDTTDPMDRSLNLMGENLTNPSDYPNEANFDENQTLVPNNSKDFMEWTRDNVDEENDYSPKRSNGSTSLSDWKYSTHNSSNKDYSKPNQSKDYSPERSSGSAYVSDWKSSTYGPSDKDFSKGYSTEYSKDYSKDYSKAYQNVGNKYNDIIDSWNLNKGDIRDESKSKTYPSRTSLLRNFDPILDSSKYITDDIAPQLHQSPQTPQPPQPPQPSPPERRRAKQRTERPNLLNQWNDSTGLIEDFSECKLNETHEFDDNKTKKISNPDVLESAVKQQLKENELKDRITELQNEVKQKECEFEEMSQQLDKTNKEKTILTQLVQTLHNINEQLVASSIEKLDSLQNQINNTKKERNDFEKRCAELTDELSTIQISKNSSDNQYSMAVQTIRQLEDTCNQLMDKNESLENQLTLSDGKKELENEVITYKVQNKRMEMKIKALENQLEQKNKENIELSAMVDELISNVHK